VTSISLCSQQAERKQGLVAILADGVMLPFPDDTFDGILVVDALHHFAEPWRIAPEILRVLKSGGRLL
jgi:demethylmenaquinone methyltransferase/2-methoxy-6-polyprenyl-1,4-benzoquinol methylase